MSTTTVTRTPATRTRGPAADRKALVRAAVCLGGGFVALILASVFHPDGMDQNDHQSVFTEYARSTGWTADHLAFFAAMAVTVVGFLVLFDALRLPAGMSRMVARIGAAFAGLALALTAVRFAVDGVVLKRAVDAWASAPDTEKSARFADAETVRWIEEAAVSYQSFAFGITAILLAVVVLWTAALPRPLGYLFAVGGIAYLMVGWILGVAGFAPAGSIPTQVAQTSQLVWAGYLLFVAWRAPRSMSGGEHV
jgi:hypothetical protein